MSELAPEENDAVPDTGDTSRSAARKTETAPDTDVNVGQALRSAYQRTVAEDIPDDLLALLGKLE